MAWPSDDDKNWGGTPLRRDVPWVSTLLTRSCRNRPDNGSLSEGPLQKINHPTVTGNLMLGRPRLADFCLPNWNVGTNCNETGQNLADVTNEISECWPLWWVSSPATYHDVITVEQKLSTTEHFIFPSSKWMPYSRRGQLVGQLIWYPGTFSKSYSRSTGIPG